MSLSQTHPDPFPAILIEFCDHLNSDCNLIKLSPMGLSTFLLTSDDRVLQQVVIIRHDNFVRRVDEAEVELGCAIAKRSTKQRY